MLLSPFLLMAQQNSGAWTNVGPSPAAVQAIAVDPRGTGTIFMGTLGGGVRKSIDAGLTWSAANTGLTDLEVMTLAMDASGPQTVYAGDPGGGLFKTTDGGSTWQILPCGPAVAGLEQTTSGNSGVNRLRSGSVHGERLHGETGETGIDGGPGNSAIDGFSNAA